MMPGNPKRSIDVQYREDTEKVRYRERGTEIQENRDTGEERSRQREIYTAKTKYRNFETPEKEYRGLSPNFHIHASVCDLYIPTIGLPFLLEEICRPILGLYKSLTDT
jgi:hypothetical protein